jgi:hypothetical protein
VAGCCVYSDEPSGSGATELNMSDLVAVEFKFSALMYVASIMLTL